MNDMLIQLFERFSGDRRQQPVPAPSDIIFNSQNGMGRLMNKPDNCLWTSTWTGEYSGSAWIQFVLSGHFRDNPFDCYLLTPNRKTRILTIDNRGDLYSTQQRYPLKNQAGYRLLDFEAIASKYDAVHLTARGYRDCCSVTERVNLYWWDCESTVWFRPVWVIKHIGMMNFQYTSISRGY
jgi:hypothetical protein